MASPWIDLLFLHGHITDPQLARRLVSVDGCASSNLSEDACSPDHPMRVHLAPSKEAERRNLGFVPGKAAS